MKKICTVIFILTILVVGIRLWAPQTFDIVNSAENAIDRMEVEFNKDEMYLNIYLNHPVTCKEIIQVVGIQSFAVKNIDYVPSCSIINDKLVRITYNQE